MKEGLYIVLDSHHKDDPQFVLARLIFIAGIETWKVLDHDYLMSGEEFMAAQGFSIVCGPLNLSKIAGLNGSGILCD